MKSKYLIAVGTTAAALATAGTANAAVRNLALNKTTTASSVSHFSTAALPFTPKMATDANATVASRWAADVASGQWLEVDLGQAYRLSSVVVGSGKENGYGILTAFKLQGKSVATGAYVDLASVTGNASASRSVAFAAAKDARYVRLLCQTSKDDGICRVYDLKIMGDAIPAANTPPKAAAGADQAITLPANSVSLSGSGSDAEGAIAGYAWSKVSGGAATIASPAAAKTAITGLVAGAYVFRLTVKDAAGATGSDDVSVLVKPAPAPSPSPSAKPSPKPSVTPSPSPSAKPSPKPSTSPSPTPTTSPSPGASLDHVDHVVGTGAGQIYLPTIANLKCGDVIGIQAGTYVGITFAKLKGCAGKPITLTNYNGQVKVIGPAQGNWGITLEDAEYVTVRPWTTGTYGFYVKNSVGRAGLVINGISHDVEVSGLQVAEASHGIVVKEDPRCDRPDAWYPYVMKNFNLHDNLIENTMYEGFYLGFWNSEEYAITCDGKSVNVKASRLSDVKVLRNITRHTGHNGIKLRTSLGTNEIGYNTVYDYGLLKADGWDTGLTVGSETAGSVHHNRVEKGHANGLDIRSNVGTISITDNTVIDAGTMLDGTKGASWVSGIIFVVLGDGQRFDIERNTVTNSIASDIEVTNYSNKKASGKVCSNGSARLAIASTLGLDACP